VYTELKDYRNAVFDAVLRANLHPIGMEWEDYAKPSATSVVSRGMLDEASIYVGIFAQRYGRVTIEELRYAEELGLPVLVFFADEPLNAGDVESDPHHAEKLAAIKEELRSKYTVAYFRTREQLGIKALQSLLALREEGKLSATSEGQAPAEQVPTPPDPYYAHPYIGGGRFVGRKSELGLLDAWASSADPTLLVEAIGGTGKSALTWEWVQHHMPSVLPERAGLVWWSFYESQATVGKFLAHTLAYLTNRPVEACSKLPRGILEEQLLTVLRTKPAVIVLDGVERLLLAYHRHDAAHLADAVVQEESRRCIDPRDGTLLRRLSQGGPTKVLITSRLVPQDLQTHAGALLHGVRHIRLPGLSGDDAVALLKELGVSGDATLIRSFLSEFGDHALLIQVLAGRIRAYKPEPSNFDAWYKTVGRRLELRDHMLVSRQASILEAALEDLDPMAFRVLARLAAFHYPVDYAAVVAINPFHPEDEQDLEVGIEPLHQALTVLEERGLAQWDRAHNRYDLHPIVRAYAYGKLEDKESTYKQVQSYFQALPPEDTDQAKDVADLRQTLELYHALLNGGQPDDAVQLYKNRLDVLFYGLGAYTTIVELLSPLFTHGFDQPPTLSHSYDQSYIVNDLAATFYNLGDHVQAQRMYSVAIPLDLHDQDALYLADGLGNLGRSFHDACQLALADRAYRLSLALAQVAQSQSRIDISHRDLVHLSASTGAWAAGEAAYAALQASPEEHIKTSSFTFIHYALLRFGQGQDPTPLLAQGLRRAHEQRFPFAEREAQRLTGEVAFAKGDLAKAQTAWQAAYAIAQRQTVPLGSYLADLARLHAARKEEPQAKAFLTEALALSGFGVALAAVEVYTLLAEPSEAKQHVDAAYREAWADGPPYAFYQELNRIRAAMKTLGMPEPQLPPFDPSCIQPLPNEAQIRAFIEELKRKQNQVLDSGTAGKVDRRPWWKFWSQN
jgi:tetratricopeptide (TPR) repeat protein